MIRIKIYNNLRCKVIVIMFLMFLLLPSFYTESLAAEVSGSPVNFSDKMLEEAVRKELGKPLGDIYPGDMARLEKLTANNVNDLTGLESATSLRELMISAAGGQGNFNALESLPNLRNLTFGGNAISDTAPLAKLVNLERLTIFGENIRDLSSLGNLTNLERLEIDNTRVENITALGNLVRLKSLDLWQNRHLSNISALSGLTSLKSLRLQFNYISNISALAGLNNLEILSLDGNRVSDISALAKLEKLSYLTMNLNRISDITPLRNLTRLTSLELTFNRIKDASALESLKSLSHLYLKGNDITDITPLAELTSLQSLNLNGNRISQVSPLLESNKNQALKSVYLKGNSLDLGESAQNLEAIQTLIKNGAEVVYHPQRESSDLYNTNISVYVNGKEVVFVGQNPFIDNSLDMAFVPVRSISEALGSTLTWDQEQQRISITKAGKTITLIIGSRDFYVNEYSMVLEAPVMLSNGRAVAPLGFFSPAFDAGIRWEPANNGGNIYITY